MAQATKPFQPIAGPPDHYSPPATGLSTERGDSWFTVVEKINAGFAHVYDVISGRAASAVSEIEGVAAQGGDANAVVSVAEHSALADEVAQLRAKLKHYADIIDALLEGRGAAPPAQPSDELPPQADPIGITGGHA